MQHNKNQYVVAVGPASQPACSIIIQPKNLNKQPSLQCTLDHRGRHISPKFLERKLIKQTEESVPNHTTDEGSEGPGGYQPWKIINTRISCKPILSFTIFKHI
uniref:(northern house mosquito) hypothetical protein n=1 Tax=Culex pipiens TaxID=7175 RepID=A0A8D8KJ83_CULPI